MSMQDPIADMLTRLRNAAKAAKRDVSMPASALKKSIVKVLKKEGFVGDYAIKGEGAIKTLTIDLKYFQGVPVIEKIQRISKPGLRVYAPTEDLPQINGGMGVALISTSKGVMTDKAARKAGIGGEVLCSVF